MNWEKAKNSLDKINLLWQNIRMTNDLSPLERDLMLSYLRQLYESFLNEMPTVQHQRNSPTQMTHQETAPPKTAKPDYIAQPIARQETQNYSEPVARPVEPPKQESYVPSNGVHYTEERVVPAEVRRPAAVDPQPVAPVTERAMPAHQPVITAHPVMPAPDPDPIEVPAPSYTHQINPSQAILRLFDANKASDLSEKLSQLPISDLSRAFGVNERILIINELFGGDSAKFVDTIRRLNSFTQFNDAKAYLVREVAMPNHWAEEDKSELATSFIRLIRRKYPSV